MRLVPTALFRLPLHQQADALRRNLQLPLWPALMQMAGMGLSMVLLSLLVDRVQAERGASLWLFILRGSTAVVSLCFVAYATLVLQRILQRHLYQKRLIELEQQRNRHDSRRF